MNNDKMEARIFLIDDHPVVRQGLAQLLRLESYAICGESGNSRGIFEKIRSSGANIALLDLSLGEENGLDLIVGLRGIGIRVLVCSVHEDAYTIKKAFASGADGYICKREHKDIFLCAMSELLAGQRYIGPLAALSLANSALNSQTESNKCKLSNRESNVIVMLARGDSNMEIASSLKISVRTVETYISRIIIKLKLKNTKELRKYAIRNLPS